MGAPQIIYLVFMAIGLVADAALDGQEITSTHSFAVGIVKKAITVSLLFWGGFFGGG
jgi:hypothetical protein